jgi:hypothetical protein
MKIKLYHGTTTKHLDNILKQGITPRHDRPSNWDKHPSREDMVYLTNAYAIYFAQVCCDWEAGESPVVLEVLVDEKRLYPDEDFLEQASRNLTAEHWVEFNKNSIETKTSIFRQDLLNWQDQYQSSLNNLGNACYKGTIKPKNILRYSILSDCLKTWEHGDPSITLMNYMALGEKYRHRCEVEAWEKPISEEVINL